MIDLKDLKTRELPALDDAFAKQASEQETLADLRKDLEQRLKDDAERRQTSNRRDALLKALVEQLEVELPEALIQQESRNLLEQTAAQFAQQGMDVKSLFTPDLVRNLMQNSRPEAEERLRRSFALTALADAEDIKVEDKDVDAKIKEVKKELSGRRQDRSRPPAPGRDGRPDAGSADGLARSQQHPHRKVPRCGLRQEARRQEEACRQEGCKQGKVQDGQRGLIGAHRLTQRLKTPSA